MKNKISKIVTTALVMAAMACMCVSLTGCGGVEDQDAIQNDLKTQLEAVKAASDETVETLGEAMGSTSGTASMLEGYGLTTEQIAEGFFDGFDYDITNVEVSEDGKTAQVTMAVTCKSMDDFMDSFSTAMEELQADDSVRELGTDELNTKIGETILSTLEGIEPKESGEITIGYTLTDGQWTADEDVYQKIILQAF